jgi:hypothetical protein
VKRGVQNAIKKIARKSPQLPKKVLTYYLRRFFFFLITTPLVQTAYMLYAIQAPVRLSCAYVRPKQQTHAIGAVLSCCIYSIDTQIAHNGKPTSSAQG